MIALKDEKNIELMEEFGVLTKTEMLSRYEVELEHYSKILNIEARTMLKIANKQLIPAASAYMGELASSAAAKAAAVEGISTKAESKVLVALSKYTDEMSDAADDLKAVTDKVSDMDNEAAKAHAFHDEVIPAMDALRAAADKAEELVDEDLLAAAVLLSYVVLYRVIPRYKTTGSGAEERRPLPLLSAPTNAGLRQAASPRRHSLFPRPHAILLFPISYTSSKGPPQPGGPFEYVRLPRGSKFPLEGSPFLLFYLLGPP